MLIFASTPEETAQLEAWASERIPHLYGGDFGPCVMGGVVRHGALSAVVAFYEYRALPGGDTMRVSVAADGPHWARPAVLAAVFHYAFVTAGVNLLEAGTPHGNAATIKFLRRVGFQQDAILPHRYGNKNHMAVFSMSRAQWRRSRWFLENAT